MISIKVKQLFIVAAIIGVWMMVTACGNKDAAKTSQNIIPKDNIAHASTAQKETVIIITAGNKAIKATLDDSKASEEFIALLPQTISMKRWGNREYYGKLPSVISQGGYQRNNYKTGDVAYWPQGNSFAIFYNEEGSTAMSSPLVIMGKLTSDLNVFFNMPEVLDMKIEISN